MFLGLDIGGSQCRAEWWPAGSATPLDGQAVQPAVHGAQAALQGLLATLRQAAAVGKPMAAVCALAGAGDAALRAELEAGLAAAGLGFPVAVVGDTLAAAAAALRDGPGALLWAGTGSFAIARSAAGELVRVGGRGYLLSDQGSGYDLVRRAAAAALLALDDLGPPTALGPALTAAFQAPAPARLGAVLQRLDSGAVASRLPVVLATAAAGDLPAQRVLDEGAAALAALLLAALRRAGLAPAGLPFHVGGGVLANVPAVLDRVVARLGAHRLSAPQRVAPRAAALGAAWLAAAWHRREAPGHGWVGRVAL